MEAISLLEIIN